MFAALKALSVLGCLHSDLLVADRSQRELSAVEPVDAAIAAGKAQRDAGHADDALGEFQRGLQLARNGHDPARAARCLTLIGATRTCLFRYREALAAGQQAFRLARQIDNYTLAGAASSNIGDFPAAEHESAQAVALLQRAPKPDAQTQDFLTRAMLLRASLCFLQGKTSEGEGWAANTIVIARKTGNTSLEALPWDESGMALRRDRGLVEASTALKRAYGYWQSSHHEDELAVTKAHLAELALAKPDANYASALRLVNEAFAVSGKSVQSMSQYYPIQIRGHILLRLARKMEGLAELRRAVDAADQWRRGALPGDTTNSRTLAALNEVYSDFAKLAAGSSVQTHNVELRPEALEVLAGNRAASLREPLTLAFGQDFRLPENYFHKLSELKKAQARVTFGSNREEDKAQLVTIRLELGALENQLSFQIGNTEGASEKKSRRNSLKDIQGLSNDQLRLSFCLGKQTSFLWAISLDRVYLYQLERKRAIGGKTALFTAAVNNGRDLATSGEDLRATLFGQLPESQRNKLDWMIVGDGVPLTDVPLAGLLVRSHCLRFLPSELLLLGHRNKQPESRLVGIGDPFYNAADSRLRSSDGSSERGKPLPVAGWMGLSRSGLLAGAAAVILSARPTPDSGRMSSAFYTRFQTEQVRNTRPGDLARTEALQLAQSDTRRGNGYTKSPTFWAAYSIISKE